MAKITRTNPKTISKPFASYSHVVTAEGAKKLVFCAGQVAADVKGNVLPPDDFGAQAKMVMQNLKNALAAGGADVTGITLSSEQLQVSNARSAEKNLTASAKFLLSDYRDIPGRFDRIVSVGMFEHVGVGFYETFFRRCADLLSEARGGPA